MIRLAILISGRGSNMKAIVDACQNGILKGIAEVVVVLSNKMSAKGLDVALEQGVASQAIVSTGKIRSEFEEEILQQLNQHDIDYVILAGFMRRLTKAFTEAYPDRIINIHPADTALHRGLGGYDWAWENKLPKTKITVHFVNDKIDEGKIIAKATVDLKGAKSLEEVEARGLAVEHRFFAQALKTVFQKNKS